MEIGRKAEICPRRPGALLKFGVPFKVTVTRNSIPPPSLQVGTIVADRFRLVRQIGEGGMGSVWLADHLGLGIQCAMKFAEGDLRHQPDTLARFEREARVEAQLRSPHVVHVYDHGTWNKTPFIAMEYLRGESLATQLESQGRLDYPRTQRVIAHAARALMRAHAIGVVHRDLKPENILFVQDDDGDTAKLLDFGVAKWNTEWAVNNLTKAGLLVGTPLYMSPEQARGNSEIDGRSDLWSLAVIAYQCLTGDLPFVSDGLGELLAKIMFDPIPLPSQVLPTLPPEVDAWWIKASCRDLAGRFQTAKELSDGLAAALRLDHPTVVAATPVGLRPMAMSDDGLSVSGPGYESHTSPVPGWANGRNAKLVGVGLVGVVAMTMATLMSKPKHDTNSTSSAAAGAAVSPPLATATPPTARASEPLAREAPPAPTAPAAVTASAAPLPGNDGPKSDARRTRGSTTETKKAPPEVTKPEPSPEPAERKMPEPVEHKAPKQESSPAADFGI
jgi:serine/threonine-protein kinase